MALARSVAEAIQAQVPLSGTDAALDYGCGTGLLTLGLPLRAAVIVPGVLMMGLVLLYAQVGSLAYSDVFDPETVRRLATTPYIGSLSVASVAVLLLFGGTMGKSAQFPLHVWLPDAMEGPTPVSALIHAATMVTAGVFLVCRMSPLYEYAPDAKAMIVVIGATTAFFAATVGLVQNDIKRVIARKLVMIVGDASLCADGEPIYSAKGLRVGLFNNEGSS